jgi:hypothetical protein
MAKTNRKKIRTTSLATRSKTPGGLSPAQIRQKKLAAAGFSTVDGKPVAQEVSKARTLILKGNSILKAQSYTNDVDTSLSTTKKIAIDLLGDLGCTLVPLPSSFSFMGNSENQEKIDNPRIRNPKATQTSNTKIAATKNFPNDCDPIYTLDEPDTFQRQTDNRRARNASQPNLTYTAMTMVQMNMMSNKKRNLKQFLDETAFKRSSY